jgi:hypothetical protein
VDAIPTVVPASGTFSGPIDWSERTGVRFAIRPGGPTPPQAAVDYSDGRSLRRRADLRRRARLLDFATARRDAAPSDRG